MHVQPPPDLGLPFLFAQKEGGLKKVWGTEGTEPG